MEQHQPGVPDVRASASTGSQTDEWDVPLGGLPGLARVRLERTHVEGAVAEVRFVSDLTDLPESVAAQVWEALGTDLFPVFEPSTQMIVTIEITPEGPVPVQDSQQGWLLATSDRSTAITLLPKLVIVQTREYERYSRSLGVPLQRVLELFTAATGVSRIQRLGLRYINRLTDGGAVAPTFWRDHIREPFAGPLNGPVSHLVAGVHQQVELRLDETAGARVQSGVFTDQQPGTPAAVARYSYLVDIDVYREQAMAYDSGRCADHVRQLNRTALAVFANVLSEQYLAELHPVPAAPAPDSRDDMTANAALDTTQTSEGEPRT